MQIVSNGSCEFFLMFQFQLQCCHQKFVVCVAVRIWFGCYVLHCGGPSLFYQYNPILFLVFSSGDVQVYNLLGCFWNMVCLIASRFASAKSTNISPLSFLSPKPAFPTVPFSSLFLFLLTLALKSPARIRMSCLFLLSISFCSVS